MAFVLHCPCYLWVGERCQCGHAPGCFSEPPHGLGSEYFHAEERNTSRWKPSKCVFPATLSPDCPEHKLSQELSLPLALHAERSHSCLLLIARMQPGKRLQRGPQLECPRECLMKKGEKTEEEGSESGRTGGPHTVISFLCLPLLSHSFLVTTHHCVLTNRHRDISQNQGHASVDQHVST